MKIKKIKKTGSKRYPVSVTMDTGKVFRVPQQKKFGEFSRNHGCSLAAVALGLQLSGIQKDLDDIYVWAKKHLKEGYTGSKLTIYGCSRAINGLGGKAKWYPITDCPTCRKNAIKHIRQELSDGAIVLIEQRSPIHTNVILGRRKGGIHIATNGAIKRKTIKGLVAGALRGAEGKDHQDTWYKGGRSKHAAGYVVVKG